MSAKRKSGRATANRKAIKSTSSAAAPAMKFCRYHQAEHSADLQHFASNKAAKDGLYYICKEAEKAIRAAKGKATAAPAMGNAVPSNTFPLAATVARAAKGKKRSK